MRLKYLLISITGVLVFSCTVEEETEDNPSVELEIDANKPAPIDYSYRDLSNKEFAEYMYDPEAVVLDVRAPKELSNGMIKGAVNIDYESDKFEIIVSEEIDKESSVYVYCQGGSRSAEAAQKLVDLGFENVYNLENGYEDWDGEEEN